jgi:mannose-6-phosphate isomerase
MLGTVSDRHDTRPWGEYFVPVDEPSHTVKRIVEHPGQRLGYQYHEKRAEHWVVVAGTGVVILDGGERQLAAGDTVEVPERTAHRIASTGDTDLVFIEVQTGTYFGEDDIERLEDDYGRVGAR